MPKQSAIDAAKRDKAQGKSAGTQAGEFVKAEIDRMRSGQSGARNARQAIAIGLSEARRAGVDLKPPAPGKTSAKTRKSAESAYRKGQNQRTRTAAQQRTSSDRSAAAKKAAKTRAQH